MAELTAGELRLWTLDLEGFLDLAVKQLLHGSLLLGGGCTHGLKRVELRGPKDALQFASPTGTGAGCAPCASGKDSPIFAEAFWAKLKEQRVAGRAGP